PVPAFAAWPQHSPQPSAKRTAHTAPTLTPTRTHIPPPPVPTHASLHAVRDTQERRPVRSRSQSRPGQAREADSRPGPSSFEEHRSKVRSTKPTAHGQANSFYRTHLRASIARGTQHRSYGDAQPRPPKVLWGRVFDPAGPSEARLASCHEPPQPAED